MSTGTISEVTTATDLVASIQAHVDREIDATLATLPDPARLSAEARRGIVARYAAVLEGNFIYWMTGAYLAAASDEARAKIVDNLREEVRDCHPGRFPANPPRIRSDRWTYPSTLSSSTMLTPK